MQKIIGTTTGFLLLLQGVGYAQFANWLNDIDFDLLTSEYGTSLATGSNVSVTIVESGGYPDVNDARFIPGKTMTPRTGVVGSTSHATIVGALFFGDESGFSQRSVAPGVANIDMYTTAWSGAYFLTPGTVGPMVSPNLSRVASHAYGESTSLNNLSRIDYVVERDDFIQVVGSHAVSGHGNGFNSISVAPSSGLSGSALDGTQPVSGSTPYVAGRYRPDVTGPRGTTSDSIGATAGVVALLVSRGKTTTSFTSYMARPGYSVESGHTSEVIKAALMAGASRQTSGNLDTVNITDYRTSESNRTSNGLDKRFGAGLINVYNSYKIIDAGELNSAQDTPGGMGGGIGRYGFDYDPSFGGAGTSNTQADYGFVAGSSGKFIATLAWNLKVVGPTAPYNNFSSDAALYNLDISLIDLTTQSVVQSSASLIDNTENIWADVISGHQYLLRVTASGAPFEWDYGLAWRSEATITPLVVPEPWTVGWWGGFSFFLMRRLR